MEAGGASAGGRRRIGALYRVGIVVLLAVFTACSSGEGPVEVTTDAEAADPPLPVPGGGGPGTTQTTAAPTTTTTADPPASPPAASATPAPPPPPLAGLGPVPAEGWGKGARGPDIALIERRLSELHFDVHVLDDVYDEATEHAVVAFQKVTGLGRTGRVDQKVVDTLNTYQPAPPLVPGGGPTRVEIDLPRQVLFLYQNDAVVRILPVSTGSGKRFCHRGRCRTAVTPPGSYRVGYRINGWRRSPLGRMYKPVYYMVGIGIAIHGYHHVPSEPASHGCVRIPMFAAETFPDQVPDDTPVYVLDGVNPPAPAPPPGTET